MTPYWTDPTGAITVYHGDARSLDLVPDGSVQLVVTSPPYFNAREQYASWPTYDAYLSDMATVWGECYRVLCDGGRIAVNVPLGYGRDPYLPIGCDVTAQLAALFRLRGHIIWDKTSNGCMSGSTAWGSFASASNPCLRDGHEIVVVGSKGAMGREPGTSDVTPDEFKRFTSTVWPIRPVQDREHPAVFPDELPYRLIKLYSYAGDTVLDPFLGSGTVARVARRLGRRCIGVDRSERYCALAAARLGQLELTTSEAPCHQQN